MLDAVAMKLRLVRDADGAAGIHVMHNNWFSLNYIQIMVLPDSFVVTVIASDRASFLTQTCMR